MSSLSQVPATRLANDAVPAQAVSLNLAQRAGRCMMVRIVGTELDQDTARFLREHHIGGVCLFRNNMRDAAQLKRLIADLRAVIGEHALIAVDQEGGAVTRTTWLPVPPSAMSLGASHDPALCYEVGAAVARGIRELGFNWNFAPVVDVNSNPRNPIIAERSFGATAAQVGKLAAAWMQGSLDNGVACCLKHFPGHGDTQYDSHRALPVVDSALASLRKTELSPFAHCIAAPAVMTAHILYRALDADLPATLSSKILRDLLRGEMGFAGVIVTDDMAMQAIADTYGAGHAAVMALQAGADLVLALGSTASQLDTWQSICHALEDGTIALTDNEASVQRLQQLAQQYPCRPTAANAQAEQQSEQQAQRDAELMAQAWRRGISVYGNPRLPVPGQALRLVMRADTQGDGVSDAGVNVQQLRALLAPHFLLEVITFDDAAQFDWNNLPADGKYTVLASTTRKRYPTRPQVHRAADDGSAVALPHVSVCADWTPNLHLVLWGPYLALDVNAPALISYGFAPAVLAAVVDCLCGKAQAEGTLQIENSSVSA